MSAASCHSHTERDAVYRCMSCGRPLCPDCARDLEKGFCCKNRCEDRARDLILLMDQNIAWTKERMQQKAGEPTEAVFQVPGPLLGGVPDQGLTLTDTRLRNHPISQAPSSDLTASTTRRSRRVEQVLIAVIVLLSVAVLVLAQK